MKWFRNLHLQKLAFTDRQISIPHNCRSVCDRTATTRRHHDARKDMLEWPNTVCTEKREAIRANLAEKSVSRVCTRASALRKQAGSKHVSTTGRNIKTSRLKTSTSSVSAAAVQLPERRRRHSKLQCYCTWLLRSRRELQKASQTNKHGSIRVCRQAPMSTLLFNISLNLRKVDGP